MRFLLIFLCFAVLHAEEAPEIPIETLKPTVDQFNILIHDCVNVITGHYVENETDLTLPGPRPMNLSRSYSSGNEQFMTLRHGWNFDLFSWCHLYRQGERTLFHSFSHKNQIVYFSQGGGAIQTGRSEIKEGTKEFSVGHHKDSYIGWCHTDIYGGAKSHRKNLHYSIRERHLIDRVIWISDGCGKTSGFYTTEPFSYEMKNIERCNERLIFPILRTNYPNGHYDTYTHLRNKIEDKTTPQFTLAEFHGAGGQCFGSYAFDHQKEKIEVTASNDCKAAYQFWWTKHKPYLRSVEVFAPGGSEPYYSCQYEYAGDTPLMAQKREPEGRFLKINYLKDEGKVMYLKGPMGTLYRFEYDSDLTDHKRHLEGETTVYDANENKTIYSYAESRLTQIVQTLENKPYATTSFYWTDDESHLPGLLKKKEISGLLTETYDYDLKGNLIKETLTGNLTGQGDTSDVKRYTYIDNGKVKNLLHEVVTGRNRTTLAYYPDSDLVKSVIQQGSGFRRRQFYFYDENNLPIKKIQDDGETFRKVTETIYEKGLPVKVVEKHWNPESQEEQFDLLTEFTYNYDGKVLNKKITAWDGKAQEFRYEYDAAGRCIWEVNPEGEEKRFSYDALGNLLSEETEEHQQRHTYDLMNRRIQTEHTGRGIPTLIETWSYDKVGNKISHTDHLGTSAFAYDGLNRLVTHTDPVQAERSYTYDVLGHKTSERDPKGNVTSYTNTIRGMPSSITYPDGSVEKHTYTIDGLLEEEQFPDGLTIRYSYDPFSRVTHKKWLHNGALLKEETNRYSAYFLLSTTKEGRTTNFSYNARGQLIEEREGDKVTAYEYDGLGNKIAARVYAVPERYVEEHKEYDLLGREIRSYETDETGEICKEKSHTYNCLGKVIKTIEGDAVTTYDYDAFGNLTSMIDPNGHKTTIIRDYQTMTTTVYPNGTQLKEIKDPLDRVVEQEFCDPFGKLLQKQITAYNLNGDKVREEFVVFADGEYRREVVNTYKYDIQDRLIMQVEAKGTHEEKVTSYAYDCMGRKTRHIKPGVTLSFAYDPLGRLIKKSAPGLEYAYEYDARGRLICLTNVLTGKKTVRRYDRNDNIIEETLETGLTLRRAYDGIGRPTEVTLPDGSTICYEYAGSMLRKVRRKGERSYAHEYCYDSRGRLISEDLPLRGGEIEHSYEAASHWTSSYHKHLKLEALGYDAVYNLAGIYVKDGLAEEEMRYRYDALNQLIEENGHEYRNDSLYNRIQKDEVAYNVNALNQLTAQGGTRYRYDSNGNLIRIVSRVKTQNLSYDSLDRLLGVEEGEKCTKYEYDGFNRRIVKSEEGGDVHFLYDDKREIGSYREGEPETVRILGVGVGSSEIRAAIAIETGNKVYLPLHNPFGHLALLLDGDTGKPVQHCRTTAFGECKLSDGTGEELAMADSLSPWIISSKRYDPETGFTLYGLRYYCPEIGRWITPDPAGFVDGPNLYAYVRNNPLIYTDLYGLNIFSGIVGGVKLAAPFIVMRGVIAVATIACPPAGAALQMAMTCYNLYAACSLACNATSYVGNSVLTDGVGGGVSKMMADAKDWVGDGERLAEVFTSTFLTKKVGNMGGKGATLSKTAQKVDSVAANALKSVAEKGLLTQNGVPAAVPQGIMPSLDALSKAGQVMDRGGLTRAGRALNKHGNRLNSVFPKAIGDTFMKNLQGQYHLDDILTHPNSWFRRSIRNGYEFYHPDGRGAYFHEDRSFRGFIEEQYG